MALDLLRQGPLTMVAGFLRKRLGGLPAPRDISPVQVRNPDARSLATFQDCTRQRGNHMFSLEGPICFHGNALAGKLINHCQDATRAPIRQLVADAVGRSALIRTCRRTVRDTLAVADLPPLWGQATPDLRLHRATHSS